jgi:hypothetical protein
MKLKKVYLLLSILLFSNLFYIESAKTSQLFDIISNDGQQSTLSSGKTQETKPNSIFDSVNNDKDQEPINFNQIKEKVSEKNSSKSEAKTSLFSEFESQRDDTKESKETPEKDNSNAQSSQKIKEKEEKVQTANNTNSITEPVVPGMTPTNKNSENALEGTQTKKVGTHNEEARASNIHEETKLKTEAKTHQISNNAKSLEEPNPNKNLKQHITALLEMNERLLKRMKNHNKSHKKINHNSNNMLSFIQNYEKDIKNLKNNLSANESFLQKTLNKKDEEIKNLYSKTEHIYGDLENKLEKVSNQMNKINTMKFPKFRKLLNEPKFLNVNVDNSLMVEGDTISNKVYSKEAELAGVKFGPSEIAITDENTRITFGNESLSIAELFENIKAVKAVLQLCGNNFENCLKKEEELHEKQFAQQKEILESLKNLRMQTAEIINNHRKRLR